MRRILARALKEAGRNEIGMACHLTLGEIASQHSPVNLGMAGQTVIRAIAEAFGREMNDVAATAKKIGDIGLCAEAYAHGKGMHDVRTVFTVLNEIAKVHGQGSQDKKIKRFAELLKKSSPLEARYLARIALGQLRLGLADKTLLDALSIAFAGDNTLREALEHAYNILPDISVIAETLARKGRKGIEAITPKIGTPIQMMLCQRIKTLDEIEERCGFPVTVETKYDGERVQAHKDGKNVTLFSRRLENITHQFPEITEAIRKLPSRRAIIEGEIIALDKKGKILPFQTIMQRRRKHNIAEYARKIPVVMMAFDCLLDGKSLLKLPYEKRYAALRKIVKNGKTLTLAKNDICKTVKCAEHFFTSVVKEGGEGIVIKKHDGTYQAGVRGWNWIKWKPEYLPKMRDTFDLVVVGAFWGRGRRAGRFGALLCAVYDEKKDEFLTFCKLGSGFTDELLKKIPTMLNTVKEKPARVLAKDITPDVWIAPEKVVEVIGAEVTKSPMHAAGYALRFPRFLRWREKKAEQATTVKEVAKLVKKQSSE